MEIESEARVQAYHIFYRHWLCVTNGYAYQITAWGSFEDADAVRARTERLFSSFTLIDSQRQASRATKVVDDFHSQLFGYTVKLGGLGWRPSPLIAKNLPAAEFTGWDENKKVALFVIPVCLLDQNPPLEALTQAMAELAGIAYPGTEIMDEKPINEGDLSGVEFGYERADLGGKFVYRIKILRRRQWAYLLGSYYQVKQQDDRKILEDALARVEFVPNTFPIQDPVAEFNERDKNRHGLVFNQLGLFHYKARQFEKSAAYFQTAFEFERNSPVFLANAANAYLNIGKRQEALEYLERNPSLLATNNSVRATQAYLQMQLGQTDKALTNFRALFTEGYRNDDYFVDYITLLSQTRQQDVALAAVEDHLKDHDSAAVRLLEARLYLQKKNFNKAIELLKTQTHKYPYNAELALSLADAYCQAGLYSEAVAACQQLIDTQSDSASVYYVKGRGEFGLKRYREAKASFEVALKRAPASTDVKSYLDLVSGMLGEGNNSGIKDPIAPVPIPEKLLDITPAEAPASYTKDYGARYLKDITVISFTRKKEFKRSEYLVIKVLDPSGIAAFSTIQFGFDPLGEGIFVNDLKVKDEEGKVVSTGNVADYYVVDAAAATQASQKKVLNIPISGLKPGYLIELTVTRQDLAPPEEFPFTAHACITAFPILQDILVIRGETNTLKYTGAGAGNGFKCESGLYWVRERPEVYKWEPMEQSPMDFMSTLYVGDGAATWEGEVKKYLEKLGDYLQLDAAGRELASRLAKDSTNESDKVISLARYVQTNYIYKALEFGRRARIPHRTAEIVRNQYGDCKDHSLLLQKLLEAAGIQARLALVGTRGKVQKDLPSLDQFDHMVVYLPGFRNGFFIDCTDKGSDLAQTVPLGLAGKEALILDAANPRFVRIPDYPDGSSRINSRRELRITNDTDMVVHETLSLSGCNGSALRSYFKGLQPASRRYFADLQVNRQSGEITSFKLQNLEDTQAPLVLELDYVLKRQFRLAGNQLVGKLPDVWEQSYAAAEPVEDRATPFELTFPVEVETTVNLATPAGYQEPGLESFHQDLRMAFATSHSEAQKEGRGLKIDYRLQRRAGTFAAAQYGPYRENMVKALEPLEQTVTFTKKP